MSADPRYGEEIGKVPGTNPSSRFSGHPEERGHLEATTVRAFLVSAGFPTAGVTEEAHLHCRKCGRVLPPIQGRQERTNAQTGVVHRRIKRTLMLRFLQRPGLQVAVRCSV
ncbi:hypothetical protein HOE425_332830 [Hoeflea sp. EC-HK425]|nr:hypothetical protein HOE425_332830 [Hoeflea sp. EC-HK425]